VLLRIIYPLFGSFTLVRACLTQLTILANVNSIPNTPAGDSWNLYLGYTPANAFNESLIPITFLPTGEIDLKSTSNQSLDTANALLAPTINAMRLAMGDPEFDFWNFANWLVVSYYWLFLSNFGQTSPTYYNFTSEDLPNLLAPVFYSSTNNIFVNSTLFSIYSSYLTDLFSFVGLPPPEFLPLDNNNSLQQTAVTFLTSYSCMQRQPQPFIYAAVSVLVADYVFIAGGYSFVIIVATWWKKRRTAEGKSTFDQTELVANLCEGCISLKISLPLDTVPGGQLGDDRDSRAPLISKASEE
jgi:hypothetical protein